MRLTFDKIASLATFAIGLFFVIESKKIATAAYGSVVGPNVFPFVLGILLMLLSVKLFFEAIRSKVTSQSTSPDYLRFLLIFIVTIGYIFVFIKLGYILSTFFFLFITFQIIEKGQYIKSLFIAAAFSAGVYYLFVVVLKGTLPSLF
ncbi:MAG: tripartite tricarboxylate transporter TctB family protein [Bacillaceae bacterium]